MNDDVGVRVPRQRRRRPARAGTVLLPVALMAALAVVAVPPPTDAAAASSPASSLTKSGRDTTTGSSADSSVGTVGTTRPGDTVKWVMHYTNNTGADASVNETDPISGSQTYVPGSLVTPPGMSGQWSTDGGTTYQGTEPGSDVNAVGATGTVQADTTAAASSPFSVNSLNLTTPGGDGYTVEGQGGNLYTVFHHDHTATTVYCATLTDAVCPGWPAQSTYVNPTSGTPIGTGGIGPYTTGINDGSFIAGGNLYWPVQDTVASGGNYTVGMQCLDLTSLTSCGFTQLGTIPYAPLGGTTGLIIGDGIAAADGNYYFFDESGDMLCFSASTGACGSTHISGAQIPGSGGTSYPGGILTSGQYLFVTFNNQAIPSDSYITCYDTSTSAACPGFPINDGLAPTGFADFVAPVLSSSGAPLGACDVTKAVCYSPAGAALANPYAGFTGFGYPPLAPSGFGLGAIDGTKYYAGDLTTGAIDCFDFASWSGSGAVPACSGFTGQVNAQNYTVRTLANLPGCLAADGNAGQILLFDAQTGGACVSATTTVALTDPSNYYCDGQSGHASNWGTLRLHGLTGSEYTAATVTLTGVNGPVPGFTDLRLANGQTSLDLSSLPVSGSTASLTADVTLTAVTDTAAVTAANVTMSWTGDPIQTCFETTVAANCPASGATVSNAGNVVTTGSNSVTDAPGGVSSGTATFVIVPTASQCALDLTKTASTRAVQPGGTVRYTVTVTNAGTAPWTGANPAQISDSLAGDLTDTSYDNDATATTGTVSYNAPVLSWSGPLAPGASATITYAVTVDNPDTGPRSLTNTVTASCPLGASCTAPPAVVVPVYSVKFVKTASVQVANPGGTVTYTVTVTNTGQAPYTTAVPAMFTDDLSGDFSDAVYNHDATATAGTVRYHAPVLSWSGPLEVGKTVRVVYSVTVDSHDDGPYELHNTLVSPDSNCMAGSADPRCGTITTIPVQFAIPVIG